MHVLGEKQTKTKQADNLISSALTLLCASPVSSLGSSNERCALSVKVCTMGRHGVVTLLVIARSNKG